MFPFQYRNVQKTNKSVFKQVNVEIKRGKICFSAGKYFLKDFLVPFFFFFKEKSCLQHHHFSVKKLKYHNCSLKATV